MTMARIQPCLGKLGIDLCYYNGDRGFPRAVTNRDTALYLYNNHFCLIWKSQDSSFNQAIQELKNNFKIVDNYISVENVNSHFEYVFVPKKIDSHLSNFIVYDLETQNTDKARPSNMTFHRISKIAGRYDREPTQEELKKSIDEARAFAGDNCNNNALDFCLKLKGEERKVKNKIVEYILQMHTHNGSSFDNWIILNNTPCDKHIVTDIVKNGKSFFELKVYNGLI